jgi:DNA-binding response OmpR family regulator
VAPPTRTPRIAPYPDGQRSAGRLRAADAPWRSATAPEPVDAGIVIIDDQRERRNHVRDVLRDAGFDPRGAVAPSQARELAIASPIDLVVMDAGRSDVGDMRGRRGFWEDGLDPRVMFVGGPRDARLSIRLLEIGDDHLAAPYVAEEMVARARAILRRRTPREVSRTVTAGPWTLDLRHRVLLGGERPVMLTRTEAAVLAELMEQPGVAVSKQAIMQAAWGHDFGRSGGVVETYVSYLRRKFAGSGPRIRTIRSSGYLLDVEGTGFGRSSWAGAARGAAA